MTTFMAFKCKTPECDEVVLSGHCLACSLRATLLAIIAFTVPPPPGEVRELELPE